MRGDLARTLYELTKDEVEYCFGDSIQSLKQDEEGVDVTFERGGSRRFDLLVGADGLHSIHGSVSLGKWSVVRYDTRTNHARWLVRERIHAAQIGLSVL